MLNETNMPPYLFLPKLMLQKGGIIWKILLNLYFSFIIQLKRSGNLINRAWFVYVAQPCSGDWLTLMT